MLDLEVWENVLKHHALAPYNAPPGARRSCDAEARTLDPKG